MKYFLLLLLFCCACSGKKPPECPCDFESLMGQALPAWKYVQTKEDFQNLAFFKEIYEKNIAFLKEESENRKIPKVIHFIWIGPKAFPIESVENVRTWIAKNPGWTIKFWTDRKRPLPHPDMQLCMIRDFPFRMLESEYNQSDNYAEKSDLLRLEILYREGGLYVDHDVLCLKSFEPLCKAYDFFCGMEAPYPTTLSTSVWPTNNTLGARPGHILIEKSMEWLVDNWQQLEKEYPGNDRDSLINRIAHRSFLVLGKIFKSHSNLNGNVDIALPTYYFNSPKIESAIYAQHQYKGTWFENESVFEKNTRKRLMMLSKKTNKLLLAVGVLGGLNLLGFTALGLILRKNRLSQ